MKKGDEAGVLESLGGEGRETVCLSATQHYRRSSSVVSVGLWCGGTEFVEDLYGGLLGFEVMWGVGFVDLGFGSIEMEGLDLSDLEWRCGYAGVVLSSACGFAYPMHKSLVHRQEGWWSTHEFIQMYMKWNEIYFCPQVVYACVL